MTASFLIKELVKDVARRLPVLATRGVLGISMGGNAAISMALQYPKVFSAASALSGAVDLSVAKARPALIERLGPYGEYTADWEARSALQMVKQRPAEAKALHVRLSVGKSDLWAPSNRELNEALVAAGADVTFDESEGNHSWAYWAPTLPAHLEWQAKVLHEAAAATK